jgi:hypothetical protein
VNRPDRCFGLLGQITRIELSGRPVVVNHADIVTVQRRTVNKISG